MLRIVIYIPQNLNNLFRDFLRTRKLINKWMNYKTKGLIEWNRWTKKKKKKRFFRPNYVSWFPGNSPLEYFLERARAFPSWNSRHGNRVQSQFHAAGHLEPSRATSKSARRKKNEAWSLVVSATDQTMEKDPRVFPSTFPKFSHPFSRNLSTHLGDDPTTTVTVHASIQLDYLRREWSPSSATPNNKCR